MCNDYEIPESMSDDIRIHGADPQTAGIIIAQLRHENHELRGLLDTAVDAFENGWFVPGPGDQYFTGRMGIVPPDWLAKAKEMNDG